MSRKVPALNFHSDSLFSLLFSIHTPRDRYIQRMIIPRLPRAPDNPELCKKTLRKTTPENFITIGKIL